MWTAHKLYFLCSYLVQTLEGMHGNPAFPDGIVYLDCFAGAGVSVARDESGISHRLPGSSLIAASLQPRGKSFSRIYAVESDAANADALERRIANTSFKGEFKLWRGDFNRFASQIAKELPSRALTVAFVDPYSLDIEFSAIESIARARSLDLIILFSDRIDLGRNLHVYMGDNPKLDLFLGAQSNWRDRYAGLTDRTGPRLRAMFADIYASSLSRIGYKHSESWPLDGPQGPMFRLVFASKNPLGLKYCQIARREDFGGERTLFGPR